MLAVGEVGSWLPPWNPVHHLDSRSNFNANSSSNKNHLNSRLKSEVPQLQREEEVKPTPERVRKKSRKKTAEPVLTSVEADRSESSSSGGSHGDLATQVKRKAKAI